MMEMLRLKNKKEQDNYFLSQVGPGKYENAKWSEFNMIAKQEKSNVYSIKPTYSFRRQDFKKTE